VGWTVVLAAVGVVSVPLLVVNASAAASSSLFRASPSLLATLTDPNPTGVGFGVSVAVSGTTAVVSADGTGAVYIYTKSAAGWPTTPTTVLNDPDLEIQATFGASVAISGSTVLVGATQFGTSAGAAYLYVHGPSGWPTTPTVALGDPGPGDHFGVSVAISATTAIVGADETASGAGAAYIYANGASGWSSTSTELIDPPETASDHFGGAVAASNTTVLVGAYGANSSAGAAYLYHKNASGWTTTVALADPGGPFASFGGAVAITVSKTASTAVVGAENAAGLAGAAYIYAKGVSGWPKSPTVSLADPGASFSRFGRSVAVSANTAVSGAQSSSTGKVFIYTHGTSGWPTTPSARLTDPNGPNDDFGESVADSGTTAIIGAPNTNSQSGAAYIFAV
jgi:hypothetical protein